VGWWPALRRLLGNGFTRCRRSKMENAQWSGGLVSGRRWRACESSTVAGSRWGCGEEMERERGRERFGGKMGFGDKKMGIEEEDALLFSKIIYLLFFFSFFFLNEKKYIKREKALSMWVGDDLPIITPFAFSPLSCVLHAKPNRPIVSPSPSVKYNFFPTTASNTSIPNPNTSPCLSAMADSALPRKKRKL